MENMGVTCDIHKNVKKKINRVIKLGDMGEKRKLSRITPVSPKWYSIEKKSEWIFFQKAPYPYCGELCWAFSQN
jgi:hypothetical protein